MTVLQPKRSTLAQVGASFYSSQEYYDGYGHGTDQGWVTDLSTKILLRSGTFAPSRVAYWVRMTLREVG